MKSVTYSTPDGPVTVEYDETAPCFCCGLPVGAASMSGTVICPACDCGYDRIGRRLTLAETMEGARRYQENLARCNGDKSRGIEAVV